MKKIALLLAAATIILTTAIFSVPWFARGDPLKAKFDKLQRGMTVDEVEGIFVDESPLRPRPYNERITIWETDDSVAIITFSEGKVETGYYSSKQSDAPWDRLLDWLGIKRGVEANIVD
jgi:hypothetical protein